MKPSDLKYNHEIKNPDSNYFTRETMKFFGDTMSNYGCRKAKVKTHWDEFGAYIEDPVGVEVWELYRKRSVKGGLKTSAYFHMETFERVHAV